MSSVQRDIGLSYDSYGSPFVKSKISDVFEDT